MITEKLSVKVAFDYFSEDGKLLELINYLAKKENVNGYIQKKENTVEIVLSDEKEKVEKFLDTLGKYMPVSIFIDEAKTQVLDHIEEIEGFFIKTPLNILPQNLSLCPLCIEELTDQNSRRFYFPFISCSFCGHQYSYLYEYPFKREKTVFKFFVMCEDCKKEFEDPKNRRHKYPLTSCHSCLTPIYLKKGENERYGFDPEKTAGAFNTASGVLSKGNILKIYTQNGEKLAFIINEENIKKVKPKEIVLLITDPSVLPEISYISNQEIKALASIEKPVLILQAKEFKEKSLITDTGFIKVKLPDDPVLLLLSIHLRERNVKYIALTDFKEEQEGITEFEFGADLPVINKQRETKAFVAQNRLIIVEGEKGILPTIIKSKETNNLSIAKDYAVLDLGNGEYLIDKKEKILHCLPSFVDSINSLNTLHGEYEFVEVPYEKQVSFKPFEGAILSALAEHGKLDEPVIGIYFSYKFNTDVVAVKTTQKPLKSLIWIKPIKLFKNPYQTAKYALEQIKLSSPEGERLYNNYKEKFKEIFEKLEKLSTEEKSKEVSSITAVLNSVAVLTGMFNKENDFSFEEPYLHLQTESLDYTGKSGLKVDFVLTEENGVFLLDWVKLIQSVLSYKLAGVDNKMIAFSVFEGLGDWLIDHIVKTITKLNIENIALTGSFFANPVLTGRIIKHFSGKKNILINKRLPIDEVNIAFGGIFKEVGR